MMVATAAAGGTSTGKAVCKLWALGDVINHHRRHYDHHRHNHDHNGKELELARKRAPHNQFRERDTEDERDRRGIQRGDRRLPQRQRPPRNKHTSSAKRRHSEGHPTARQRQCTNGKAVAQTDNRNHETNDDKADECSSEPRLLHPGEGQDIGASSDCRAKRHGKDP